MTHLSTGRLLVKRAIVWGERPSLGFTCFDRCHPSSLQRGSSSWLQNVNREPQKMLGPVPLDRRVQTRCFSQVSVGGHAPWQAAGKRREQEGVNCALQPHLGSGMQRLHSATEEAPRLCDTSLSMSDHKPAFPSHTCSDWQQFSLIFPSAYLWGEPAVTLLRCRGGRWPKALRLSPL